MLRKHFPTQPSAFPAWWLTFLLLAVGELIIRQFKAPLYQFQLAAYALSVLTSLFLWLFIGRIFHHLPGPKVRRTAAIIIAFLTTLLLFSSFFTYSEFGEFISDDMLSFVIADPLYFRDFTVDLLFNWTLVPFTLTFAAFSALWLWTANHISTQRHTKLPAHPLSRRIQFLITLAALIAFAGSLGGMFAFSRNTQTRIETSFSIALPRLIVQTITAQETLRPANRQKVEPVENPTDYNVLIILNESWGRQHLGFYPQDSTQSTDEPGMPLLEKWLTDHQQEVFIFENFFTNSGATNVSVPSLLTGVAPYEPNQKLHSLPLPWQWAHANNMHSIFVTPQRYTWANFNKFFFSDPPDQYATAETIDSPIVNDTGVDDMVTARRFQQFVHNAPADQPLFAVYGTNATHGPFQENSEHIPALPTRSSKYARALLISDAAIAHVLQTLQDTNRLDNTIIILTADHATAENVVHLPRLYSFYDEIMRIPFIIRVPKTLLDANPEIAKNLHQNLTATASNVDLIPTVIDLLNLNQSTHNAQILTQLHGRSLARPTAPDHTIIGLNTNDVRSWKNEGFGIFQNNLRFVFSDIEGPQLFDTSNDPTQNHDLWPQSTPETRKFFLDIIKNNHHTNRIYQTYQ